MNLLILMGRLTKDPELKHITSGIAVTSFTIAVNRQKKDDKADFIDCVAWGNTAEFIAKYFTKGQMINTVGRLQVREYTDKDGNKHRVSEDVVDRAFFCGDKKSGGKLGAPAEVFEELDELDELDERELPF